VEEGLPSSSSSFEEQQQQQQQDAFLLSMTFGNSNFNFSCDCSDDECNATTSTGDATTISTNRIPRLIREAVVEHNAQKMKRQRLEKIILSSYYAQQTRELIRRECGFALYRLSILPAVVSNSSNNSGSIGSGGDPIVEYRNNHRIIYIHRLNSNTNNNNNNNNNKLYSIGEGIIGSAYEESTRKQLHWTQGSSYLLPKCTGIACGWVVVRQQEQQDNNNSGDDYAVDNNNHQDDKNNVDEKKSDKFIIDDTMKDNSCNSNSKVTTAAAATTTTTTNVSMDNDAAAAAADETMKDNSYSNSKVTTDGSVVDNDATADAVIMYSLKVSSNDLQSMIHTTLPTDTAIMGGTSPSSTWVVKARQLFLGRLSLLMNKKHDDDDDDIAAADEESLEDCIALSENETAIMKLIIELAS
jgi:hypothetical protein